MMQSAALRQGATIVFSDASDFSERPSVQRVSFRSAPGPGLAEQYDLLVLDAFSSDSIPVHLLTVEAFELYVRHLRQGGVLAVHVSTVHLNLAPLVHRLGLEAGLHGSLVVNPAINRFFTRGSRWVLLSREASTLQDLITFGSAYRRRIGLRESALLFSRPRAVDLADAPLWTDDYSDLFSVVTGGILF